jgi:hypothetical protein
MQIILNIPEGVIFTSGKSVVITLPDTAASASVPITITDALRSETRHLIIKSDNKTLKVHTV